MNKKRERDSLILKIEKLLTKDDSIYSQVSGGKILCRECSLPASIFIESEHLVLCVIHAERRRMLLAHRETLIQMKIIKEVNNNE